MLHLKLMRFDIAELASTRSRSRRIIRCHAGPDSLNASGADAALGNAETLDFLHEIF